MIVILISVIVYFGKYDLFNCTCLACENFY